MLRVPAKSYQRHAVATLSGAEAEGQQMSVREAKRAAKRARDGDDAAAAPRREKKAKKGVL